MAAIEALQAALGALRRNPVLFLGGLLIGLLTFPQVVLQFMQVPLVPTALTAVTFFVTPFLLAGLLGMADEALVGPTDLGTLTEVGRDRYVSLLLGNLVQFAISLVFGIALLIAVIGGAITVGASAGGIPSSIGSGAFVAVAIAVLLLVLAFVLVFFFIQFFAVAIVVDEEGPIEGFTASYRVVRHNLLSALGYSVIVFVIGVVTMLPVTGFTLYRTFESMNATAPGEAAAAANSLGLSAPEAVAIGLVSLAMTVLLTTFQQTYAVAFYRRHAATEAEIETSVGADDFDAGYSVE